MMGGVRGEGGGGSVWINAVKMSGWEQFMKAEVKTRRRRKRQMKK